MLKRDFPAYQSAEIAARWGCFSCHAPLDPATMQDMGYLPKRGQYAMRCVKCSMLTFFDLKDTNPQPL